MKNIFKTTIFAFLLISLGGCTNDIDPVVSLNGLNFRDVSPATPPLVLEKENALEIFNKTEWDKADYGVLTANPGLSYVIIVSDHDADPNFLNAVDYNGVGLAILPERSCTLKVGEFNDLINKLPTFNCGPMNIDIRVKSTLGTSTNAVVQYSNPITVAVTGYSTTKKILAFATASQPLLNAPKILSSNFDKLNDFEGYMYLEAGDYKFYQPDACGSFDSPVVYGGSAGVLTPGTSASAINVPTAGHYLVKANLTSGTLTYSVQVFRAIGLFGTAIRTTGTANPTPMSYNPVTKKWEITVDVFKGKTFRFKSNNWVGNVTSATPPGLPGNGGPAISTLGAGNGVNDLVEVTGSAGDITVPGTADGTKQSYTVTVDLNSPRNYTYTLKINN